MRLVWGVFIICLLMFFIFGFTCATIIGIVTGRDTSQLHDNFELCIVLAGVVIGLGIFGGFLLNKEKSKTRQKNKLIVDKMSDIYDNKGEKKQISEISTSNKKRITPPKEVLKELLKRSGNRCNFHPCPNVIINYQVHLKGHLVFIMTNEKGQPHYNPKLSDEDKMKIDNLMLLCDEHYLDLKFYEKHAIDALMTKKREAEESPHKDKTFEISDRIIEEIIQEYVDRYPSDES